MYDDQIHSVAKAIQMLDLFTTNRPRLGISEISRAMEVSKGTVQGLVRTLTRGGFLQQDQETRKYKLGLKIYELGRILAESLDINQKALNPAHQLALETQHLVLIGVLDGDSALVTMDAYPRSRPFISAGTGPRAPLYCTALGKALLAFLDPGELEDYLSKADLISYTAHTIVNRKQLIADLTATRKRGYAVNCEEHLLGYAGIGAPIFGHAGSPVGAVCLVVDPMEVVSRQGQKLAKEVTKTASEISRLMGFSHRPLPSMRRK